MEYTKLGNTEIEVSKVCVGCMSFGKAGTMHDWTLDAEETETVVKDALSLGINFFDTANGYSAGTSEEYLGQALKKNISRDKVVIASKVYFNPGRLSSEAIHREIDGTLKMQQIALAWHWAKGVSSPIIGATKASHLEDAAKALDVKLEAEDISYLEEPYIPHRIVGAIDHNPADGVMLLDEKK
ncbi:aldo/keto reductase [Eubacterium sp. MSJ-13]|uniref:aldo/keto reductase n=1 Tax=Eubacterium sp. MSJ-13 TaxID=2841513 RepID=UPI001C11FFFB|nr:aldo/keto reductase [Eubacterium sp. MSJ-13]MBU5479079.1 aldo/keto reductase [Eubacterium sp. MSJ-13]